MGYQDIKELVAFGLSATELAFGLADGLGGDDLAAALAVAKRGPAAFAGAANALDQYKNMTDAEAAELEAFIVADFDIANDAVEAVIETVLTVLVKLHELAQLFPAVKLA